MKICLVSAYFTPLENGGAERAARRLAESRCRDGWEVVVLTAWPRDEIVLLPSGIKIYRVSTGAAFFKGGLRACSAAAPLALAPAKYLEFHRLPENTTDP